MSRYTEDDIIFEGERHWVLSAGPNYEVLKYGATHSTVRSTYGKGVPNAMERAIEDAKRRDLATV